ncbi:MAG TPA: dienelactone hydrolase family protein [Gammaproteobacteria bacterium]|nr:dienelactone hydrolase family protein [Gammaproteobacteria bacterium]
MQQRDTVSTRKTEVVLPAAGVFLEGTLSVPDGAYGVVAFAHGSGSSRFSRRNQWVAQQLNDAGLATLLLDLLTSDENERDAVTAKYRFDISLLAGRMSEAVDWLAREPSTHALPVALFGASTGAAAALIAAAERPGRVKAVVSRGGRPDLADGALPHVRAPTLLIVGGQDTQVIAMNRDAASQLTCSRQLTIVPGATHLFEEAGALERVAALAEEWIRLHLGERRHLTADQR